jgi:hypothetical protein
MFSLSSSLFVLGLKSQRVVKELCRVSGSHKRSCLVLFLVSALGTVVSFGGKLSHSVDLASIRTCCHMHAAATQRRELRYEVRRGCECLER